MRRSSLLLALVVSLLAVAPASAAVVAGNRWPGKVIRYHASGGSKAAVDAAAKAWNRSGLKIRFKRSAKGRAGVLVRTVPKMGCAGYAQVGFLYPGPAGVRMGSCQGHEWPLRQIAVHELGHILGLDHETKRCAMMNTTLNNGAPNRCKPPGSAQYRCRPYERDDLLGLRKLYGGRIRDLGPANCPLFPAPAALPGLTATAADGGEVTLAYELPQAPRPVVDDWFPQPQQDVEAVAVPGACPADAAALFRAGERTRDSVLRWGGRQQSFLAVPGAGLHCVAARLTDPLGRSGPVTTATVTVAPPPVEAYVDASPYAFTGEPVAFGAEAYSQDDVVAYAWDFGDPASGAANRATGRAVEHAFSSAGTYTVTLAVQTSRGATATATHVVEVTSAEAPPG